jgi:hypothetical protein
MVSPQFPLQGPQVPDSPLNLGKLRGDQLLEAGAQVLAAPGVSKGRDLPDADQGKADLLGPADEPEALEVALRVHPVPRGGAGGLGQEAKRLVVPNGLWIDAAFSGQLPDPHGLPPLEGGLLTDRRQYRSSSRLEMQGIFS